MMNSESISFFTLIHDYLKIYLPKQRKLSPHTIRSYRKALEDLIDYVKDVKAISIHSVNFGHLTTELLLGFMDHLKKDNNCTISTCNTRLAAIRAFMEYAAGRDITIVASWEKLKNIAFEKTHNATVIEHMSMKAVSAIMGQPDLKTAKGLRDRVFIVLLYDSAARVQEMLDIRLCDLQFSATSTVMLHGKS